MRGAGNTGVVTAARTHLGRLDLRPFGTRDDDRFRVALNSATTRLRAALPEEARCWGLARKGLNIFLRDCLYNQSPFVITTRLGWPGALAKTERT